jgi:hypothetical protein
LGITNPNDYLEKASGQVRAANALRDDLLAVLFPRGSTMPSELLQTRVRLKLLALVASIEKHLLGADTGSVRSWDILSQSGLLREPTLIHFALARVAEDKLKQNMQSAAGVSLLSQLSARLLNHENNRLADMATKLLNADQLGDEYLYQRLDGEHLHQLCWRIVAVLQQDVDVDDKALVAKAEALLSEHSGDRNAAVIARKLVFFLGGEHREMLLDPSASGSQLFIASLCEEYGLESDLVYRLIAEASTAPLLLMLKGKAVAVEQLPGILAVLRGSHDDASPDLGNIYALLDPVEARATVKSWAEEGEVTL